MNKRIGLIGAGNMGSAILEGAIKKNILTPSDVWIYDKQSRKSTYLSKGLNAHKAHSLKELIENAEVILLAIKPQDFHDFAYHARKYFRKGQGLISILAGMTITKIQKGLGSLPVVRAMPNLAAKAGASMTVCTGKNQELMAVTRELFEGCGEVAVLPESKFDQVTAMSGSGPAYFFLMMELLAAFGVRQGIPSRIAADLAIQTGIGAALLARSSKYSCKELRQMVTSKRGTTEAALTVLARKKFDDVFLSALFAAAKRSRELRSQIHA